MADPDPRPPRRPFEGQAEPEPFHRTPEFQRFLWLASALGIVLLLALYFAWRSQGGGQPALPARAPAAPLLVGPGEQAAREQRLITAFEGSLQDTQNGDGFIETTGYRRLLEILMSYTPEEISTRSVRHLDYAAAMADPDAWRGEFVWTRGIVAHLYAERLNSPVFGAKDRYQGVLTEADGSEGIVFDMGEQPPAVELRRNPVDVEGIFYRTIAYEDQKGPKTVPYLLVRNLRPVREPESDSRGFLKDPTAALFVGLAIAILAACLLVYAFHRRRRRPAASRPAVAGIREMLEKRIPPAGGSDPRPHA